MEPEKVSVLKSLVLCGWRNLETIRAVGFYDIMIVQRSLSHIAEGSSRHGMIEFQYKDHYQQMGPKVLVV
jgi:hypothetical protein